MVNDPITVRKSLPDGRISLSMRLKASGWSGVSVKIDGNVVLTTAQARMLARELIAAADHADAKVAAKAAAEQRRQKWREREVASGRMVILGRLSSR